MPLFWTTWRKLLVTSVEESELKLFKKKGAGICPHAFCKICVAAMTSLLSGPLANIQVGKLGKIHFEHFDGRWEGKLLDTTVCYQTCLNTRCGWHCECHSLWKGIEWLWKMLRRQTEQKSNAKVIEFSHLEGAQRHTHPTRAALFKPSLEAMRTRPSAVLWKPPKEPCWLGLRCKVLWTQVPTQQSVSATEMGLGETTHALCSSIPEKKHSLSLGWPLIYSTREQENPSAHGKNYCGGPHRGIWLQVPTASSMAGTHGQEKLKGAPHL